MTPADLAELLRSTAAAVLSEHGLDAAVLPQTVTVERPRNPEHGDYASNLALQLGKKVGANPRELAQWLAGALAEARGVASAEAAGPGFINLTLKTSVWIDALRAVLGEGETYGRGSAGAGEKVNVEYVSANPTGPMHVGHCRGAVFGDALCSLLATAGFDVCREYYINDAGAQVDVLARSAFLRYREALGQDIGPIPEGLYPGDYLVPVGQALAAEYGDLLLLQPESEWLPPVRERSIAMMMAAWAWISSG